MEVLPRLALCLKTRFREMRLLSQTAMEMPSRCTLAHSNSTAAHESNNNFIY